MSEGVSPKKGGTKKDSALGVLPALLPFVPEMLKQELFKLEEGGQSSDSVTNLVWHVAVSMP